MWQVNLRKLVSDMDIKEQFEEFIKTEEFIFDEKEVAIKTFNFMQAEITRLQKQNDVLTIALNDISNMTFDSWSNGAIAKDIADKVLGYC